MLEQKMDNFTDETEQQRKKFKTWQHGLEETLELKVQEFTGQDEKQREENEGWRQEPEMQQLTYQTEQERENNENQHLEENLLINQNKHQNIRITI